MREMIEHLWRMPFFDGRAHVELAFGEAASRESVSASETPSPREEGTYKMGYCSACRFRLTENPESRPYISKLNACGAQRRVSFSAVSQAVSSRAFRPTKSKSQVKRKESVPPTRCSMP